MRLHFVRVTPEIVATLKRGNVINFTLSPDSIRTTNGAGFNRKYLACLATGMANWTERQICSKYSSVLFGICEEQYV
jgi:hypothetical protein